MQNHVRHYFLLLLFGLAFSLNVYSAHMKVRIYKRVGAGEATNAQYMTQTHGGDINFEEQTSAIEGVTVGGFQSEITLMPSSDNVGTEKEPECIESEAVWEIDASSATTNIPVIKWLRGSQFIGSKYVDNDGGSESKIEETGIPLPSVLKAGELAEGVYQRKVFRPYYKADKSDQDTPSHLYKIEDYMNGKPTEDGFYGYMRLGLDNTVSLQEIILELLRNGSFKEMQDGMRFVDDLFHMSYGTKLEICFVGEHKKQIKVVIKPYMNSQIYVMLISLTNEQLLTMPLAANSPALQQVVLGVAQNVQQGACLEPITDKTSMLQ